jgi:hypothetical protein
MAAQPSELDSSNVLYDIRQDAIKLSQIRAASLSTGQFGLTTAHGIVGSPEWWKAVDAGRIKVETFVGVIRRLDGGPMGDSAIVRIEGDGETKSWTAWEGFNRSLIGKRIEIRYACVPPKNPPKPDFVVHLILEIRAIE